MTLTFREVDQIMRIIEEFPADEVRFEYGDLKLQVRRDGAGGLSRPSATSLSSPSPAPVTTPVPDAGGSLEKHTSAANASAEKPRAPAETQATQVSREGLVPVIAPMMGVFYEAPSPNAPPFVSVGQQVEEGSDLCIIEVMKVMNNIMSPCAGRIVEVTATNNTMVERGSAIFWIEVAR